jgi:putative spermidine/putrescine transport system permease protein
MILYNIYKITFFKEDYLMQKKINYMLLVPGIVIIMFFLVIPLISAILPTFFNGDSFTIQKYVAFFKDTYYLKIFSRTLRISIISAIICMFLGVPVGYFISRSSKNMRGVLIASTIFPMLTNSVVRSFAWINILGKNGVVNSVLTSLHIVKDPINLLYTEFAIIIGSIYLFLPLMIVSLVGVMENIEEDLLEAAESLGASRLKAFFKIVFPLSVPGLIVGTVLVFTGTLTAYTTPQLLGGNKNTVLATLIYQKAMTLGDWNSASVVATIMIVTTIIVIKVLNRVASILDKRGA